MNRLTVFWRYHFPAIAWGALIFAASSIPSTKIPSALLLSYDKVVHGTIFFVLGVLVYRAVAPKVRPMVFAPLHVLLSIGVVILYGATDEFHQAWVPGRSVDALDLAADTAGGLLAALAIFVYARWRQRKAALS
jgi:VanZ family protein